MAQFSTVALCMAYHTDEISDSYQRVAAHLLRLGVRVLVDQQIMPISGTEALPRAMCLAEAECLVMVGGDGSMLSVASEAAQHDVPLVGINRGHLGFLSDVHPNDLEALTAIVSGQYQTEQRSMLSVSINDATETHLALNEVVLSRTERVRLVGFEIFVDQRFMCHHRADGLIVSTPTGSTAYALSAGGPILQPGLNAVVLVPLHPHRLNSRPIVVDNTQVLDIHILAKAQTNTRLSCDGHVLSHDGPLCKATICQAKDTLTLLHPPHYDYFETLKTKLHWERKDHVDTH